MMAIRYTAEQREWLLRHYPKMTNGELAEAFGDRFGTPTTREAMHSYGSNHHLRKDPETRSRALRHYTDEEEAFLREYVPGHSVREISDAFEARFGRPLTKGQLSNLKYRLGVWSGVNSGWFEPGHETWSKGKTWDEMGFTAEQRERMRASHFRPRNAKFPAGHWTSYARFVWMQHNGRDWPEGHRVMFCDHDNRNFEPDNIMAVPDDLAIIVQGNAHGHALPYHDRDSLEVAINHAKVIRARTAAQRRLRDG